MNMKRLFILFFICVLVGASSAIIRKFSADDPRPLVILSVNDMHANIANFPKLVTAIKECRDTADVILLDAGDKWTGNAYVDLVEHYTPIYELMNYADFDFSIYGNHEFDKGQAYVAEANRQAQFLTLGANIISDTSSFPQPPAYTVIERGGLKIAFVGVVGNYDLNNHPAGFDESYKGVRFSDPQKTASQYAYLKDEADLLILVAHMGLERDKEFLNSDLSKGYDMVVGAHSHDWVDEVVGGRPLGQTKCKLANIGATRVSYDKDGNVVLDYENIPLKEYNPDKETQAMVEGYLKNEMLNQKISVAKGDVSFEGLANLFLESMQEATVAAVSFYNAGGVRLSSLSDGQEISYATILDLEPFNNYVARVKMTTTQMEKMILSKFNDTINLGESHSIDLLSSTPYTVVTDSKGDGLKVVFDELVEGKLYDVAMGGYVYTTYQGLEYSDGVMTDILVSEAIKSKVSTSDVFVPDNSVRANIK